jgi:hypothetical protein
MPSDLTKYPGYRFPVEVIQHAVWLYHLFSLSLRDIELILAERGIVVSHESVRRWCLRFGADFAAKLRKRRPRPGDVWHLDEVFLKINGELLYLWRAVDQHGVVLDILVQERRNATAAKRFFKRLLAASSTSRAGHHGWAAQLRRRAARGPARGAASHQPIPQQSCRELTPADAPARTPDAAVQVTWSRPSASCHPTA